MYLHKKYVYKINYSNKILKGRGLSDDDDFLYDILDDDDFLYDSSDDDEDYEDQISDLVPILFSFLDGKLNENFGYSSKKCLNFLKKNNLYDINDYILKQFTFSDLFINNFTDLPEVNPYVKIEDIKINFYNKFNRNLKKYFDKMKKTLLENKFFFTNTYSHAISFYLEKLNDSFNLVLINSGDGINLYHENLSNQKFNLWNSYVINEDNFDIILNKLLLFHLIVHLFNKLDIDKIKKFLNFYEGEDKFEVKKIINNYKASYNKNNFGLDFFYKLLENYKSTNIESNFFNIDKLRDFKTKWDQEKNNSNNKDYQLSFFNSYNFEIDNNNFFTNPQKSGSCSWFSVFWLIIANLIKNNPEPIVVIKTNLEKFYDILKKKYDKKKNFFTNDNRIDLLEYSLINILVNEKYLDDNINSYLINFKKIKINNNIELSSKKIDNKMKISNNKYFNYLNSIMKKWNDTLFTNIKKFFNNDSLLQQIYLNIFLKYNDLTLKTTVRQIYQTKYFEFIEDNKIIVDLDMNPNHKFNLLWKNINDIKIKFSINDVNNFIFEGTLENMSKYREKLNDEEKVYINKFKMSVADKLAKFRIDNTFDSNIDIKKDDVLILSYDYDFEFNKYKNKNLEFYDIYNYVVPMNDLLVKDIIENNYKINYLQRGRFISTNSIDSNILSDIQSENFSHEINFNKKDFEKLIMYFRGELNSRKEKLIRKYFFTIDKIIKIYYYYFNNIIFYESLIYNIDKYTLLVFKIMLYNPNIFLNLDKEYLNNIIFQKIKYSNNFYREHFFDLLNLLINDTKITNPYSKNGQFKHVTEYYTDYARFGKPKGISQYENFRSKDVINKNYKLKQSFLNGNTFNKIRNSKTFNEMKETLLIEINQNEVYKKYLNFQGENIIYENLEYIKVDYNNIDLYFLSNFINTEKSPITCYFNKENNKFILINDLIAVNKYFEEDDYLIIFIDVSNDGEITKLKFNNYDAILTKDKLIENYPFLIFEPIISNTYVLYKKNTFYLLILTNGYKDINFEILTEYNINSSILLLEIGNNFIFPKFESEKQIYILKDIYCEYGCKEQVMFNFDLQNDKELFRLKNYNVKKRNVNNLSYCKSKSINTNNYDANLFNNEKYEILNILKKNYVNKTLSDKINLDVKEEELQKFIEKNPNCKLSCRGITNELINLFENLNEELIKYRQELSESIDYSNYLEGGIFEIILNNYSNLFKIMQTNIFLNNINKIKKIIEECNEDFSCKEMAEINSYLSIPNINRNNINFINLVFELLFGFIIKEEQWNKFDLIYNNYLNKDNELRIVNQFMMGKGKSSVIMPLLLLNLYNDDEIINIVIPNHLLQQTRKDTKILKNLFKLRFNILDDSEAKLNIINNKVTNKDLFIFDEFDMMFDPIQSNFNYISKRGTQFFNINHIKLIIDIINNKNLLNSNDIEENEKKLLTDEVKIILEMNNIKNINYGMSKEKPEGSKKFKRYVIPYARKDTPVEGANFASLLITLVLTIKYFEENDYKFEENDFINMYRNRYILVEVDETFNDENYYAIKALEMQENYKEDRRIYNIINYLEKFIIKELRYNESIQNCSFIDLMNSGLWATGFSGTVNIDLPQIKDGVSKFSQEIIEDPDEKIGVYFGLTGVYPNSNNDIYGYNSIDSIFNILEKKNYNCLIDIAALFKDYSSKNVIEKILKLENYKGYIGIFLDDYDKIKIIDIDGIEKKFVKLPEKDFIIFFSQRNIVGIDIPNQPNNMVGLAIIDNNEKYTNVAQGIFRMRKINKGQIIDIAYNGVFNEDKDNTKILVYNKLLENDNYSREFKKPYQELQNLKFLIRSTKNYDDTKYLQNDMKPLFIRKIEQLKLNDNNIISTEQKSILDILDTQINWDEKFNNDLTKTLRDNLQKYPEKLEDILFGGSQHEQDKEQDQEQDEEQDEEQEKEKEKEKEKERENTLTLYSIKEWNLNDINTEYLMIFPNENENIKNLLNDTCELLINNEEFSLYISIKCMKQEQNITYYFVELSPDILLLFPFFENIIQKEKSDLEYLFDYFSDNDLNLYLRDFPVYNSFGICINNFYHNKGEKNNLFYRYKNNNIFLILRKILNNYFLLKNDLNIMKPILKSNITFKIFTIFLENMYNKYFGFSKIDLNNNDIEEEIGNYSELISTKIKYNTDIYIQQVKNIRDKVLYFYNKDENGDNKNENEDNKYIENMNMLESINVNDDFESNKKIISNFISENKEIIFT